MRPAVRPMVGRAGLAGLMAGAALLLPAPVPAQSPAPILRPSATIGPPAASPAPAGGGVSGPGTGSGTVRPAGAAAPAAGAAPTPVKGLPNRFRSVAQAETVLFDAPSERAKKVFVAPGGMPVEVISVLREWVKIRDPLGDLAWVNREQLSDRRMVISMAVAPLLRDPRPDGGVTLEVDRGVLFELLDERLVSGYVRVRYAGGETGYLRADQVWGL